MYSQLKFIDNYEGGLPFPLRGASAKKMQAFSEPDGTESILHPHQQKKHPFRGAVGADEGTRTHMVSHRNLKPARLPVSPHPHFSVRTSIAFALKYSRNYNTLFPQSQAIIA